MANLLENKKRFVAESMDAVLAQIREHLGAHYEIESVDEVKEGGIFGFFGQRKFVVIAGVPKEKHRSEPVADDGKDFLKNLIAANPSLRPSNNSKRYSISAKGPLENERVQELLRGLQNAAIRKDAAAAKAVKASSASTPSGTGNKALASQAYRARKPEGETTTPESERKETAAETLLRELGGDTVRRIADPAKVKRSTASVAPKSSTLPVDDLRVEVSRMNQVISDLSKVVQNLQAQKPLEPVAVAEKEPSLTDKNLKILADRLREFDFDESVIEAYLNDLKENAQESLMNLEELQSVLQNRVSKTLRVRESIFEELGKSEARRPRVMVFVGPTGVGKTTTMAKIAGDLVEGGYKVALITVDTYKVGGTDQAREYSKLIDVPLEVVFEPEDIQAALDLHADKDVILMDTMGRTQRDVAFTDLKLFLQDRFRDYEVETHLCLSANTKHRDMIESIKAFNHLNVDCLLFTKLDETFSFGPILSVLQRSTKQISYVTNGQCVPGNYKVIDRQFLASLMFKRHWK